LFLGDILWDKSELFSDPPEILIFETPLPRDCEPRGREDDFQNLPSSIPMSAALETLFAEFLQKRAWPKTFCPSEVARSLSSEDLEALASERGEVWASWRDAMPAVRELAWRGRGEGECEILQRGRVLGREVGSLGDVKGPVRIRRAEEIVEGREEGDGHE
jgi:hypothetical protein